jgi:deazaflavin-dependent oxidoreductase (nitroreductase family)
MTAATHSSHDATGPRTPLFGGALRTLARATSPVMIGLAGRRWNPIFSVIEHVGRRTGRRYAAPIAARRVPGGFVISLAFGAHVDWYRNLAAAGSGTIRWRGRSYPVGAPARIDAAIGLAAFNPVQRLFLRLTDIDGYIRVPDVEAGGR